MHGLISYFLIIGVMLLMLWRHPAIALAGVLCMFGLEQWGQASHPFFGLHQTFTNLVIGGIVLLALACKFLKGEPLFANYPTTGWLVLGLFGYAYASAIWAPRVDLSLGIWNSRGPYVLTIIVLTPLIISRVEDLQASFKALVVMGSFLTLLLLAFVSWDSRMIVLEHGLGSPLPVSEMAGMVALVAILADPWPSSKIWQVVRLAVIGLSLILVVRSGSRGQLFGLIAVSGLCWPISRRIESVKQFALWVGLVLFLTGITTLALQEFWGNKDTYYAGGSRWSEQAMEGAMSDRLRQAVFLLELWFDSPQSIIFGLGNSASFDPRILGVYPHFVPLEILAEEGLAGFGLYLLILYHAMSCAGRSFKALANMPKERSLLGALVALFLFTFLLSLKQGSMLLNLELFMFAIILGKYERILQQGLAPHEHNLGRTETNIHMLKTTTQSRGLLSIPEAL